MPRKKAIKKEIAARGSRPRASDRHVESLLKKIYTDLRNPASFSSPYKLYTAAKKLNSSITLKKVRQWLETQDSYTLYRKLKTRFKRRKVLTRGLGYQHQADLLDYSALKKQNHGFTFLMTIIDCFSRFGLAIPIKNKTGPAVARALDTAWKTLKFPLKFQTDAGLEFYNRHVRKLLAENSVRHFSTRQNTKAQIVERFNRDIREKLKKFMEDRKTSKYIDNLPDYLHGYNHRVHRSIKPFSPVEVNATNEKVVHKIQYGKYLKQMYPKHKFRVGDDVRIAAYIGTFKKSYRDKTFTREIFTVSDLLRTNPPMYRVMDKQNELIDGTFYEPELQRVRS